MVADINKSTTVQPGGSVGIGETKKSNSPLSPGAADFGEILKSKVPSEKGIIDARAEIASGLGGNAGGVKFSQHAIERMASRGISFKPDELMKLNDAVEKAAQKGSRESLVLMGDNALIVSVKNKTVVTAMDREAMRENVFTNIDSTVIL